jgi:hypothetical protein
MFKKIVVSALAFTFALAIALPASAIDREEKAPKEPRGGVSTPASPNVKVFGGDALRRVRTFQLHGGPRTPVKSSCTWSCGNWEVTCSGGRVTCEDETGCVIDGQVAALCI